MNVARPSELQQFIVKSDGFTCDPIHTKEDLAIIKKMNEDRKKIIASNH